MTTFAGHRALVTGATSGIGRAIALQLAQRGAEVVVHGRNAQRGAEVVREIENSSGKARFIAAELNDAAQVRRLAAEAGDVDILINNAGVFIFGDTVDTDDAVFDEHVNVNMRAPYLLVQTLAPGMVGRGHGAIVNISTLAASAPKRKGGIYGATKAALELLTKVWADEFGESGVRVNAVAAGPTDTPGTEGIPDLLEKLAGVTALRRVADAGEIASAVVFLVSPEASYVNGAIFNVTGGETSFAR
ncbi:SDR family NAD(P)-dependent oxidoreductase [Mycobacterium camsae]|uniref:SDR family NAD(P)-dependent oxidoreductase n=1 Tax=Mycobacterium gordonae TaxID=1778 RepID=UPI0019825F56|nr:SDR family oxidoreductase [Mycobacterium gordonae]